MAKLIALLVLVAALVAVASSQYLAGYPRVGYAGYAGAPLLARGAYAAPFGVAHAGLAHPGYLGAYGARGVVLG